MTFKRTRLPFAYSAFWQSHYMILWKEGNGSDDSESIIKLCDVFFYEFYSLPNFKNWGLALCGMSNAS